MVNGTLPDWIHVSQEVEDSLRTGRPIVALESTVLAHGLPRPRNAEIGTDLEATIRSAGAVPATVAVLDGRACVGLEPRELDRIALEEGIHKLSTKDLPVAFARRSSGATTVASTAYIAARAGIQVFATGGIGGVHRGLPPDVSADLTELQRTRILLVTAGAKSILDLPATRELLETLGVLVVGWRTDRFPAFYSPDSGLPVDARADEASEVRAIWTSHAETGLPGAVLLCVPIPAGDAIPDDVLSTSLEAALREIESERVAGKEVTPFLLRQISAATGGATTDANISLLRNNAAVAAEIAVELASK
jgi:pseudouridylate synthase